MIRKIAILFIMSFFCITWANAQDKSNKGKEFWLGYGYNWVFDRELPTNTQELVLYLSADAPASVTVSVTNTTWSQTISIPANTVDASIRIPKIGPEDARMFNEGLHNKAIHIVSDTPIVVYAHTYNAMISAATMLMPAETYGYLYYSLNYSQAQSGSSPPNPPVNTTQNGPGWYSYFFVVATENNTRVEITPSDTTRNGWLPGQTYTVNLNKGEIYNVMGKLGAGSAAWEASKDLSGSKVVSVIGGDGSCHPVTMFCGSSGIRLCKNDGGENMLQQIFPVQAWGTRYLTYHTLNNTSTDINDPFKNFYRIAVADPTTVVKRNGVPLTGLVRNFYYEILDSTGGDYIEADKPTLVAQYTPGGNRCHLSSQFAYGDPEMFYLSPLEQGKKDILFYATRNSFIDYNYLNLIVPTPGISSLRLDGSPFDPVNIRVHPNNPSYSVAVARIPGSAAQHRLVCDSTFVGTMYGLGFFESYGYNIGTKVNNLNTYGEIKNTFNTNGVVDTFTCLNTPVRLYIKIAYPALSIHWKLSQVPGISPNTDSVVNNPVPVRTEVINGRTYYIYTLQQDFTFSQPAISIPVSYTSVVIPNCFQTENAYINILVKDGPKPDFTISNQLCLSDTVRFTGTTSTQNGLYNYTSFLWTFDDGSTQTTLDAKKRFLTTGTHDVRYRVTADNGCIADTVKTITILNGTGPQISFIINGKPCADSTITFTSAIPPSVNTSYWWDFGDGQTTNSSTASVTHAYAATTISRVVRHTATITGGCSPDTVQQTIPVIFTNPAAAPFTIAGDTLCINKPLQFTSAATGVSRWTWSFGNGSGNQAPPFTYSYSTAGTFDVRLTITDTNGCGSPPSTQQVIIAPNPNINAGPDKFIAVNSNTTLDATLTNPANYNIVWTPATYLSATTVLNPVTTPPDTNPITYTVTATDKISLCTGSDKVIITPVSKLYIPTGFTPNGDGKNDKWVILGLALYQDAVVSVYSRWGEKLFETKNYINNPWDGLNKGQKLPIGSYVYHIKLNDEKKQELKGTITIIY